MSIGSNNIDFATLIQSFDTDKSYYQIGDLLIYFGSGSLSVAPKVDTNVSILFSPAFADTNYKIVTGLAFNPGFANLTISSSIQDVGSAKLNFWNDGTNTFTCGYNYLVIGKAA